MPKLKFRISEYLLLLSVAIYVQGTRENIMNSNVQSDTLSIFVV